MRDTGVDVTTTAVGVVTALINRGLVANAAEVPAFIESIGSALAKIPASASTTAGLIVQLVEKGDIKDASKVADYITQIGMTIGMIGGGNAAVPAAAPAAAAQPAASAPVSQAPAVAQAPAPVRAANPPIPVAPVPAAETRFMTAAEQGVEPAVPIKESVQPDWIVCLEDGRKMKMLKRHLSSVYRMSPEQYRTRWGLPPNYPLVAPNYAKQKSKYAKRVGLGTHRMREDVKSARADA